MINWTLSKFQMCVDQKTTLKKLMENCKTGENINNTYIRQMT